MKIMGVVVGECEEHEGLIEMTVVLEGDIDEMETEKLVRAVAATLLLSPMSLKEHPAQADGWDEEPYLNGQTF